MVKPQIYVLLRLPDIVGEECNMEGGGGYFNENVERKNYNRGNMERTTKILESGEVKKKTNGSEEDWES